MLVGISSGSFTSLHQKDVRGLREGRDDEQFKAGLGGMGRLYASMRGTSVLMLQDMPAAPSDFRGVLVLYGLPAKMADDLLLTKDRVAQHIWPELPEVHASILAIEKMRGAGADPSTTVQAEVTVRFESEAAATCALHAAKERGIAADTRYNARPYLDRGWVR